MFVCLFLRARLLKNACMDLDDILRVDMDELINFWARSGSQSGIRMPEPDCFLP